MAFWCNQSYFRLVINLNSVLIDIMQLDITKFIPQFKETLQTYKGSVLFVRKHRLWEGFWTYGWVSRLLVFAGLFMGLKFFGIFFKWLNVFRTAETTQMMTVVSGMFTDFFKEGYAELFSGETKYFMLILLEVIIFHVCRRTIEVLRGSTEADLSFNAFVKAQVRMFKIGLIAWILETIVAALIGVSLGIFGMGFLKPGIVFAAQCFFLGFAVIDNYNEQFELEIKESLKYTLQYTGVALAIGVVLYILMLIPIVGPIAGPILAAVTATLVMFRISDVHEKGRAVVAEPGETV